MGGNRSACLSLQFLVLLSSCLALVSTYGDGLVISAEYDPPRMKPSYNESVVSVGGNLTLECEGKQPITWDLPMNLRIDDMQEAFSNISTSEDPHADYPYKLRLELFNLTVIDVGFYTCYFNTSENYDYSMPELVANGQAKRIYVYVDDPARLMVPVDVVVIGTQYSSITVPCRPTAPNVHVKLYRQGKEIKPNKPLENLNDRVVTYDLRNGFTIPEAEMGDSSYDCECTFFRDGVNESNIFTLSIMPNTVSVPKPQIIDYFNGNTVLGGDLHLDCFVQIDRGIPFHVRWIYPNEKYIDPKRVNISDATTGNSGDNNFPTRIRKSTIIIHNITAEDSGIYKCQVFDVYQNKNFDQKYIKVLANTNTANSWFRDS